MNNILTVIEEPFVIGKKEREVRRPAADEVVIKIMSSAVCGSDLHIYRGKHPAVGLPAMIGHELSGMIVETGDAVSSVRTGDRVTLEPVVACGECRACRSGIYSYCENISYTYRMGDGALAKYITAKAHYVFKLPEGLSFDEGALIEPLAVATHAVARSQTKHGDSVVIFGAGAIGILCAAVTARLGAERVVICDMSEFRLQKAKEMGASHTVDARGDVQAQLAELTDGCGFDRSFECVGSGAAFSQALTSLKRGGAMTCIGIFEKPEITIDASRFVTHEVTVYGSQGYCWDFPAALRLARNIPLHSLITHVFPFEKVNEAFNVLCDRSIPSVKAVIHPWED